MSDSLCEICGDAHGTGYVCEPCRSDPANADWVAERESQLTARGDYLPPRYIDIAVALFRVRLGLSTETQLEIGRRLGVSQARVSEIHRELLEVKFYRFKSVRKRAQSKKRSEIGSQTSSMEGGSAGFERALICAAWFEWRCNAESPLDDFEPPRWFIEHELGYGVKQDPPWLGKTCVDLAKTNARALCALDEPLMRVTYPKNFYPDAE